MTRRFSQSQNDPRAFIQSQNDPRAYGTQLAGEIGGTFRGQTLPRTGNTWFFRLFTFGDFAGHPAINAMSVWKNGSKVYDLNNPLRTHGGTFGSDECGAVSTPGGYDLWFGWADAGQSSDGPEWDEMQIDWSTGAVRYPVGSLCAELNGSKYFHPPRSFLQAISQGKQFLGDVVDQGVFVWSFGLTSAEDAGYTAKAYSGGVLQFEATYQGSNEFPPSPGETAPACDGTDNVDVESTGFTSSFWEKTPTGFAVEIDRIDLMNGATVAYTFPDLVQCAEGTINPGYAYYYHYPPGP